MDVSILWCQKNLDNCLQQLLDDLITIQDTQQIDQVAHKQMSATLQIVEHFFTLVDFSPLKILLKQWSICFNALDKNAVQPDMLTCLIAWLDALAKVFQQGVPGVDTPVMAHFFQCSEMLAQQNTASPLTWSPLLESLQGTFTWREVMIAQADRAVWKEAYQYAHTMFAEMASLDPKKLLACDLHSLMTPLLKLQPIVKKLGLPILIVSVNSIKSILDKCTTNDVLSASWGESFAQSLCALDWALEQSVLAHRDCSHWFAPHQSELITLKKQLDEQLLAESPASEETIATIQEDFSVTPETTPITSVPVVSVVAEKSTDIDPELLSIFEEESQELLEMIQESTQQWHAVPTDNAPAQSLKRDLHTLKGCARTVGAAPISHLVHALETFIVTLYENNQTPGETFFNAVQVGIDHIAQLLDQFKKKEVLTLNQVLIDSWIQNSAESDILPAEGLHVSEVSPVSQSPEVVPMASELALASVSDVQPALATSTPAATANKSTGEVIRIKAQDVDKFTQLATVANVSRSQLEKELTDMGDYVNGVIQGIEQLQAQLRLMQDEVQISANQQTGFYGKNSFDALEQDHDTPLVRLAHTMQETAEQISRFQDSMASSIENAENLLLDQQRVTKELEAGLNRTQLVDFKTVVPRLERLVRQVATELKKQIRVDTTQATGDIDRRVLEHMTPALEHMLRNAIDHGIETPEKRQLANKDPIGTIRLLVSHVGGDFHLTLSDDGGGIDTQAIRKKALEKNMITLEDTPSDQDLFQMILQPGFSTADKVSEISGRGVGMDVVHSEITQLGGGFEISSVLGQGTTFRIRLPFTRSMNRALLFGVKQACYGVPLTNIEGIIRLPLEVFEEYRKDYHKTLEYGDKSYRLRYLGELLAYDEDERNSQFLSEVPIILLRSATPVALAVGRIFGRK